MRLFITLLMMFSLPLFANEHGDIQIDNMQIRQPMPGRSVTAGYFTLNNKTAEVLELIAVSSEAFGRIELHQHIHKDGMMRMEQLQHITIAANSDVVFAPGGLHLMLFDPVTPPEIGQHVALELHFGDGQTLKADFPIVAMPKR